MATIIAWRDALIARFNAVKEWVNGLPNTWRLTTLIGGSVVVLVITLGLSAEYTSRPTFCPTCHYMEPYFQSWEQSGAHSDVKCSTCHFPPGIEGTIMGKIEGLVQVVNYASSSYTRRKPWAEIEDASCMQSGCHDTRLEGSVTFKGVVFDHGPHLEGQRRGKELRCTSCHSQIVQGDHIRVTETTCFLCHMKSGGEVDPAEFKEMSACDTCHRWDAPAPEADEKLVVFHQDLLERDFTCEQCHSKTIVGDGFVPEATCFGCHSEQERLDKIGDTNLVHTKHIAENKIECVQCHLQIQHKIQRVNVEAELECATCHRGTHEEQVMLFTGQVEGTTGTPNPMFVAGLDCAGCHVFHDELKETAGEGTALSQSCESCHGTGYDRLLGMWRKGADEKMRAFGRTIDRVQRVIRTRGKTDDPVVSAPLLEAKKVLHVVQAGKPVHNIRFYDELIQAGYEHLAKAATAAGNGITVPKFDASAAVPGECANCHTGVERADVLYNGRTFSHRRHVLSENVSCQTCHSNTRTHGQLVMTPSACNDCHHETALAANPPPAAQCESCHETAAALYAGTYEDSDEPDYMFMEEVVCADCHVTKGQLIRPEVSVCVDCHDDEYEEQANEWKADVAEQTTELKTLVSAVPRARRATPPYERAQRVLRDLDRSGAHGLHNYELSSGLLAGLIKDLKAQETAQ